MDIVWIALLLTLFAGLATGMGSIIACCTKKINKKFLAVSLGFAAGVMIYVSFVELFPEALESVGSGKWIAVLSFFLGFGISALIDKLVPSYENPHDFKPGEIKGNKKVISKLHRLGILVALVIAIHNFPEGLATFASVLKDVGLGVAIAIAIAIHNIPEGIAISVPLFYATGSRKKAFTYSFLSGLSEPIGGLIGYLILMPFLNEFVFGILFAAVAGIMVFISFDQLLPTARQYGDHHLTIYGLVLGMIIMAISLLLFI